MASLLSTILVILMGLPHNCFSQNSSTKSVITTCGQEVLIPTNGDFGVLSVNLNLSQPQQAGAFCSWVIPSQNSSTSNQVVFIPTLNSDSISCKNNVITVFEKDPAENTLNPLTLECYEFSSVNISYYKPVTTYPGFSMIVILNTTSALAENFNFMHVIPFVWTDVCSTNSPKVIVTKPGENTDNDRVGLGRSGLVSRLPDNLVCRWEIRSPDEGVLLLELRSFGAKDESRACESGDRFLLSDKRNSGNPIIVPYCDNSRLQYNFVSIPGTAYITFESDGSGGASENFFIEYRSVESCPAEHLVLEAAREEERLIKGVSYNSSGTGQEQVCRWRITARRSQVIKLYGLAAGDFQHHCDGSKDYLVLNGRKVGICDSHEFLVWSKNNSMEIEFHTSPAVGSRSFTLHYMSVFKGPCQGYPERNTIESTLVNEYKIVRPIPEGDVASGPVCQWLFTAQFKGYVVQVTVDHTKSVGDKKGVSFDTDNCSYQHFIVYSGDQVDDSARINATCTMKNPSMVYTSASRDMLFVLNRVSGVPESGFHLKLKQIPDPVTSGSFGKHLGFWNQNTVILVAVVLVGYVYEF